MNGSYWDRSWGEIILIVFYLEHKYWGLYQYPQSRTKRCPEAGGHSSVVGHCLALKALASTPALPRMKKR